VKTLKTLKSKTVQENKTVRPRLDFNELNRYGINESSWINTKIPLSELSFLSPSALRLQFETVSSYYALDKTRVTKARAQSSRDRDKVRGWQETRRRYVRAVGNTRFAHRRTLRVWMEAALSRGAKKIRKNSGPARSTSGRRRSQRELFTFPRTPSPFWGGRDDWKKYPTKIQRSIKGISRRDATLTRR